jgi:hypothetical protein
MNRTHFTLKLLLASLFMLQVSGIDENVDLISGNYGQDSFEEDMHNSSEQEENTHALGDFLGNDSELNIPSKKNSFDYSRSLFNMLRNQNEYEE